MMRLGQTTRQLPHRILLGKKYQSTTKHHSRPIQSHFLVSTVNLLNRKKDISANETAVLVRLTSFDGSVGARLFLVLYS